MEEEPEFIKIECNDGEVVSMDRKYVKMNSTLHNMTEDCPDVFEPDANPVPLSEMSSKTFKQIIDFCEEHLNNPCTTDPKKLDEWDLQFCQSIYSVNKVDLFKLYSASNYIDNSQLMDVCAKFLARQIQGKTAEEIRKEFSIKNDLTPEQEADIKKKNEWCLPENDEQ